MNASLVHKGVTSLPTAYNKSCYSPCDVPLLTFACNPEDNKSCYSPYDVPLLTFACNPEDAFPNMYLNGAHVS